MGDLQDLIEMPVKNKEQQAVVVTADDFAFLHAMSFPE